MLDEVALTPATVNAAHFGLIARYPVDGQIYAQPLYVPHGGKNLVLVATEHDSLYAFDAATGSLQFSTNFGAPVPSSEYPGCLDLQPEIGITSTPAVNPDAGIVYLVAKTFDAGQFALTLHAVSLDTGLDLGTAVIAADGFDAEKQHQRAGLLLKNGILYIAFAAHCDYEPYHGWVMAYDAGTLAQLGVFNTTPDTREGGIWMSGQGPAADDTGLYLTTGNGTFDGGRNLGDSALKLNFGDVSLADFFTPHDQAILDETDRDFGSGGVLIIPNTSLAVTGGKKGTLYLLDGAHGMGGFNPDDDSKALQSFDAGGGIFAAPVYWNGHLYLWPNRSTLNAFNFDGVQFDPTPFSTSSMQAGGFPAGTLSISANGDQNGIVWANLPLSSAGHQTVNGMLRAFDANDLSHELWNSQQNAERDDFGNYAKFCPPTIAGGRVYLATFSNALAVYGLLDQVPPPAGN